MSASALTGVERHFSADDVIVSKTDLKGRITYANRTFLDVSGYEEEELLGQPHSLIRHPHMPRAVFALLWDYLHAGREIFAYVLNRAKGGDHYWVLAHVTPSHDPAGNVVGYHSNRRVGVPAVISGTIEPLYARLLEEEARHDNRKEGLQASSRLLSAILKQAGESYDSFIGKLLLQG